jgi:molybdopterin-binding protein
MSLYRLENLCFAFGEKVVLDIPELTIADRKITALTGANGSGKTTLLMLLSTLLRPSSGRVIYRGKALHTFDGKHADAVRREIGFLLQAPYLFRTTVGKNVAYGLAVRGIARENRLVRVREALRWVGLEGFENRSHDALSGGEVQRVALARTLVTDPRVLLLDEPLANVDAVSRTIIERVLVEANRQQGVTVLFTTHDLDQAYRLADEVVTLNAGTVVEGTMENVYHGTVCQDDDEWVFDTGQLVIAIPAGHQDSRTAAVLPDAILLSTEKVTSSARNVFRGRIVVVRDRNTSVEVTVDAGETFTARITGTSYREMDLRLGQEMYLVFKAEAVRLY